METLDERAAWVVLASVPGVGPLRFADLVAAGRGASGVLGLARRGRLSRVLRRSGGQIVPVGVVDAVADAAREPQRVLESIAVHDLWTTVPLDADYPARLRDLDPVPPILFGRGRKACLAERRAVAIVGTRRPTPSGRLLAGRIAGTLAERDVLVISGLAIGIDGAAHATTVEHGAPTLAVLGSGHASPGPRAHRGLLDGILASGGAAVSELAPDLEASKGTFPRRNRVIAALADAVIVVEAPSRSGALITARHGLELGRPVFVAPGRPGDPTTAGCLALLRETPAQPVVGMAELLIDLGYLEPEGSPTRSPADAGADSRPTCRPAARGSSLDETLALAALAGPERAVAVRIAHGPATADALIADTGLEPGVVAGALTLLQLRGWIRPLGPAYLAAGPLLTRPTSAISTSRRRTTAQ